METPRVRVDTDSTIFTVSASTVSSVPLRLSIIYASHYLESRGLIVTPLIPVFLSNSCSLEVVDRAAVDWVSLLSLNLLFILSKVDTFYEFYNKDYNNHGITGLHRFF